MNNKEHKLLTRSNDRVQKLVLEMKMIMKMIVWHIWDRKATVYCKFKCRLLKNNKEYELEYNRSYSFR